MSVTRGVDCSLTAVSDSAAIMRPKCRREYRELVSGMPAVERIAAGHTTGYKRRLWAIVRDAIPPMRAKRADSLLIQWIAVAALEVLVDVAPVPHSRDRGRHDRVGEDEPQCECWQPQSVPIRERAAVRPDAASP